MDLKDEWACHITDGRLHMIFRYTILAANVTLYRLPNCWFCRLNKHLDR